MVRRHFLPAPHSLSFFSIPSGTRRVHANEVYQEYIKDKNHYHMNATRVSAVIKHIFKCDIFSLLPCVSLVDDTDRLLHVPGKDRYGIYSI